MQSSISRRSNKTVTRKVMEYCYEPEMEEVYVDMCYILDSSLTGSNSKIMINKEN